MATSAKAASSRPAFSSSFAPGSSSTSASRLACWEVAGTTRAGFSGGEIVAWGGAGSTLTATIEILAAGGNAEIVTVIGGAEAPIPLDGVDAHVPEGVELEKHEGGQPSWWWLLAAQ
ncbi:MAG TPA: hypothetical protein VGH14_12155 [Solirubrobacterales bacterium]